MSKSPLFLTIPPQKTADCVHPCPCGYYGDPLKPCISYFLHRAPCRLRQALRLAYRRSLQNRPRESLSRPRAPARMLQRDQRRIIQCRHVPRRSYAILPIGSACTSLMKSAMSQLHLCTRAYHRVLKLARTIADLEGSERISASHLAEALQYRPRLND